MDQIVCRPNADKKFENLLSMTPKTPACVSKNGMHFLLKQWQNFCGKLLSLQVVTKLQMCVIPIFIQELSGQKGKYDKKGIKFVKVGHYSRQHCPFVFCFV